MEATDAPAIEEAPPLPQELEPAKEQAVAIIKRQGKITPTSLSALTYTAKVEQEKSVTYGGAQALMDHFEQKGYITKSGKIKDSMKMALQSGTLELPQQFESARPQLEQAIRRANTRPPIWNGRVGKRRLTAFPQQVCADPSQNRTYPSRSISARHRCSTAKTTYQNP